MAKTKFQVTIDKLFDHSPTVRSFFLKPQKVRVPDFIAGQFMVIFYQLPGRLVKRAYSIASPPAEKNHIELCIKLVEGGRLTPHLFELKVGAELTLMGPLGHFVLADKLPENLVLVATGTGISPFHSMLHHLFAKGHKGTIQLFFGVRYETEIIYHRLFSSWAKEYSNFDYYPTVSRPEKWKGAKGYVQQVLADNIRKPEMSQVYICGLNAMIQAVRQTAMDLGVADDSINYEKFG